MENFLSHVWIKFFSQFLRKIPRYFIILLVILVIAIFFRFYNTPLRYTIGYDSSRDALVALEGARQLQLPLTGPFSSLGPFTFGPWYYIQLIIFTLLTQLPYAPWVYMGITSVLFVFVMYKIGEEIQDKMLGLLAALLTAIAPIHIVTGVVLSNAWNVPLFAGLGVLAFVKIVKNSTSSRWWGLALGMSIGLAMNAHYSSIALVVLPILLLVYRPRSYAHLITAFLGLLIAFLPLIIFDLSNHWFVFRNILYTYLHMKERIYVANSWTIYLRDFWPAYLSNNNGLSIPLTILMVIVSVIATCWSFLKKTLGKPMILLLCAFVIDFVQLRYYGGERSVSYLQYLQPFVLILFAYPISVLFKLKHGIFIGCTAVLLICIAILPRSVAELKSPKFESDIHQYADTLIRLYPNQKFSPYNCQEHRYDRMQALALLLEIKGKLDSAGMKIAFSDPRCNTALLSKAPIIISEISVIDLRNATDLQLQKVGWTPTTPKKVHEKTVRWWIQNALDE